MLNNTKGYTSTSGPATEFVISGAPGDARAITAVMTNMQVKTFYITIGNNFMLFKGRYETAGTKVVIVEIINSSNNNNQTVTWPAGLKVLRCVASVEDMTDMEQMVPGATKKIFTAAQETRVNGLNDEFDAKADLTDPRFATTNINAMTPLVEVLGTENIPASTAAGDPVRIPSLLLAGDPMRIRKGHTLNRDRGFTDFSELTTTPMLPGAYAGYEKFVIGGSGSGAQANIGNFFAYFTDCLELETGTQALGVCTALHLGGPYIYDNTDLDERWRVFIPAAMTSTQNAAVQLGFGEILANNYNRGIWMEYQYVSGPNWQICIKNTAGLLKIDTGIPAIIGGLTTVRVAHSAAANESRFWVDGVQTAPVLDATKELDLGTFLNMAAVIAGITGVGQSKKVALMAHKYDNYKAAPAHFA